MIRRALASALLTGMILGSAGCSETESGVVPVGGAESSVVAKEYFLHRLHLDLTAAPPTDEQNAAALARLEQEGNTPDVRAKMASELISQPEFALLFVGELENRVFAGQQLDYAYDFICSILRDDPACTECGPESDPCDCTCPILATLEGEREQLRGAADALTTDEQTTAGVERLYGSSLIVQFFGGSAEGIAMTLWENFLGRKAEPDEQRNAELLIIGAILPGSPAGLLFHRHGQTYEDLVDILFTSEVYREAAVNAVMSRYLGRPASPAELMAFTPSLDPQAPDVRPIIEAVVSSGEYFGE